MKIHASMMAQIVEEMTTWAQEQGLTPGKVEQDVAHAALVEEIGRRYGKSATDAGEATEEIEHVLVCEAILAELFGGLNINQGERVDGLQEYAAPADIEKAFGVSESEREFSAGSSIGGVVGMPAMSGLRY